MNINGIEPKKFYLFFNKENNKSISIAAKDIIEAKCIAKNIGDNMKFVSIKLKYV